uniref:Fe2OG dioxygenase domain-containing protein n=1 Tax=Kalanchoe fedtschenkoi TaxID=63787 RepID=A0A7N0UB70_KALFE
MAPPRIPTIDLSPFFHPDGGSQERKAEAVHAINQACLEYGFFQIINHGLPEELMTRALKLSEAFLNYPMEEKLEAKPAGVGLGDRMPAGYAKQPDHSVDKNEYLLMLPPELGLNVYPNSPPEFKDVLEQVFGNLVKTGLVVETILNECLDLPSNFLQECSPDRSWDLMVALRYYPAEEEGENGLIEHEDGNIFTFVFQDDAGGLEVLKGGEWIPVVPTPGSIIVNVSDILQVWTNNIFKSATHRVIRKKGRSRYSYAFFFNADGDQWIEPLLQFTSGRGEPPKYRGFYCKEYQQLRLRNKTHPPSKPEDIVTIKHYAI